MRFRALRGHDKISKDSGDITSCVCVEVSELGRASEAEGYIDGNFGVILGATNIMFYALLHTCRKGFIPEFCNCCL